jgi:hypothetical protein
MKLTIHLHLDNAAMLDPDDTDGTDFDAAAVYQCLLRTWTALDDGDESGIMLDPNGNRTGSWSLTR